MRSFHLRISFVPPIQRNAPTAVAGEASATVTSHVITASPGGATCTVTALTGSCTITNLSGGTAYTFTDTAVNAGGRSTPSSASAPVVPTSAPLPPAPVGPGSSIGGTGSTPSPTPTGIAFAPLALRSKPAPQAYGRAIVLRTRVTTTFIGRDGTRERAVRVIVIPKGTGVPARPRLVVTG